MSKGEDYVGWQQSFVGNERTRSFAFFLFGDYHAKMSREIAVSWVGKGKKNSSLGGGVGNGGGSGGGGCDDEVGVLENGHRIEKDQGFE